MNPLSQQGWDAVPTAATGSEGMRQEAIPFDKRALLPNPSDDMLIIKRGRPTKSERGRRTKRNFIREEVIMNTASQQIKHLTADNAQLRLRLEQALQDNEKLRLALDHERQLSPECDASNQALRIMLSEERRQSEQRMNAVSPNRSTQTIHPCLPPTSPPVLPLINQPQRQLSPETALQMEYVQRGGITHEDLLKALKDNHHSQMIVMHRREELASILGQDNASFHDGGPGW